MQARALCRFLRRTNYYGEIKAILHIGMHSACIHFRRHGFYAEYSAYFYGDGFIKAWALKEFDSSKFYIGGVKKLGILLIVAVATQLDQLIHIDSMALRTVTV